MGLSGHSRFADRCGASAKEGFGGPLLVLKWDGQVSSETAYSEIFQASGDM